MLQSKVLNETGALISAPEFIFDLALFEAQISEAFKKGGLSDLRIKNCKFVKRGKPARA